MGILIGLRNSQSVRNLFARLRISQCICEIGKAVAKLAMVANLEKWFAKLAKWFANLAMWFANLAMRNFTKLLKFYVRQMNSACG